MMFINARKKRRIFCRTESVAMTPKSRNHIPTMSLWGVAVEWPTRAPKTKLILYPRDPQGYCRISLRPVRQDFERVPEHRVGFEANPTAVFHGVCEIALTEVLATQMGVMRRSEKVSSFAFSLTAGWLRGSSCIVISGVICDCYSSRQHSRPA